MKKLWLTILIPISITSCYEKSKTAHLASRWKIVNAHKPNDELNVIERNGKSFYEWYFKNHFQDYEIVQTQNGRCLADTASYFKKLRNLSTISEKFIITEKNRIHDCVTFISTLYFSEFENSDAYQYDEYCSEIYSMYWIRSQEAPTSFSAKNIKKINNKTGQLDIYLKFAGGDEELFSTVILEKEKNIWKITRIEFINYTAKNRFNFSSDFLLLGFML